jgi:hypothetical protein
MSLRTGDSRANDDFLEARSEIAEAMRKGKADGLHASLTKLGPGSPRQRVALASSLYWYLLIDGYPDWPGPPISGRVQSDWTIASS